MNILPFKNYWKKKNNTMERFVLSFFALFLFQKSFCQEYRWQNVPIEVKSSFRALSVVNDKVAWVAGSKGWIGHSLDGGKTWLFQQVKNFEASDFRSIFAFDSLTAVIANAGSPAYIFRTTDGGKNWQSVYQNDDKTAFIDGVDFWNKKKGIAYGDPVDGKMLLLSTQNGGLTWRELPNNQRPSLKDGEASFAASGSGIRCFDKIQIAITTGGKVSRIWRSKDEGRTWKPTDLPITQGEESTGAFSAIFWKNKYGALVGGDFKNDSLTGKHVYCTDDGGKTWVLPLRPTRGLRECIESLGSDYLIAIGPTGTDTSNDGGFNWQPFSNEKGFHVIRKARDGSLIIAAGNGKISIISKK
jgi:photosystem II stability/assembly factor-like uncharacterized protein